MDFLDVKSVVLCFFCSSRLNGTLDKVLKTFHSSQVHKHKFLLTSNYCRLDHDQSKRIFQPIQSLHSQKLANLLSICVLDENLHS